MRVRFSDLTLDSEARELRRGRDPVHLSPKAFRLLEVLIDERPAAVSKERLFEIVWPQTFVAESNLASLVKEIRTALRDDARNPKLIRTVFGHGYAFGGDVTVEAVPRVRVESIAVLPFANANGAEWDYVSDGIAEALLNALVRLPAVRVVPRSTSFRYRSSDVDLRIAAREMRVEAIVTGRVSARDGELTVQAELVNAKNDSQIWGGRFHGHTSELLHLQKQIESEITTRIAKHAGQRDDQRAAEASRNDEAYDHFLRGRHQLNRRDAAGFRSAIEAFRTAADIEPSFALAHATLAEAYVALGSREICPPTEVFPLARDAASRAIAIDPSIPAAHTAMAAVQELFDWDWARAEASHRAAAALEPHYATAAQWFALHYARRGVHDEAKRWIDHAVEIEPLSAIINTNAALISYLAHDFASAIRKTEISLELTPHFEAARVVSGVAHIQVDPRRAVEELEEAARLSGRQPYSLSHLASAYAAAGDGAAACRIRDEIAACAATGYVSSSLVAISEIAVGNVSGALDALERAALQRSPWLSYLLCEPRVEVLRSEPRFRAVIASIGYGSTPPRDQQ
jgi:DNA-binding winged helix-turn-helix (wHTH) protein/tetratricopeptide (TPR) repeat protein